MSEENQTVETEAQPDPSTEIIADLQAQLKETNQKLLDANEEAMRRRKTNERLKAEMEALQSQPAPEPQANNEEIISQIKAQYEEQLSAERTQRIGLVKQNAMAELKSALASERIVAAGLEPLTLMAQSRLQIDDLGNPRIMAADGSKPLAGSGADGYATISDLAKELAASETGQLFVRDSGVSGGGKPPASQGGNAGNKTMPDAEFRKLSQKARAAFLNNGGKPI
jgi:hypothetical protein